MIHKTEIKGFDLKDLSEEIGNLRYDALQEFLLLLSDKLNRDSISDAKKNRTLLSTSLLDASDALWEASHYIQDSWNISKDKMNG